MGRSMQVRACALHLGQHLLDAAAGDIDGHAHLAELFQRGLVGVLLQPQPLAQHFLRTVRRMAGELERESGQRARHLAGEFGKA